MRRLLAWLLAPVFLAAWVASPAAGAGLIAMRLPSGKQLRAELMLTNEERALGVMFRDSLPRDRALLFVFEEAAFESFWMKNCRFPIDMVWLDSERHVVHVAESAPPCKRDPCPSYRPLRRALYVVEMNAGQARREKVRIGSVIEFTLPE
jgi:uncharacterized protein